MPLVYTSIHVLKPEKSYERPAVLLRNPWAKTEPYFGILSDEKIYNAIHHGHSLPKEYQYVVNELTGRLVQHYPRGFKINDGMFLMTVPEMFNDFDDIDMLWMEKNEIVNIKPVPKPTPVPKPQPRPKPKPKPEISKFCDCCVIS